MSWNNVIPWDYWECCRLCQGRDQDNNGEPIVHAYGCPIGKKLEEREKQEHERQKDHISDPEGPESVGGTKGQTRAGRTEPGSDNPI